MYSIVAREDSRDISIQTARICLLGILLLSAFLRFWNLDNNPPISYFEKLHADAARSFITGEIEVFDKPWTFFSPNLFYPPFFHMMAALLFSNLLQATVILRLIGGLSGLLTTLAVFLVGKEIASRRTGLYSALFFSIYPVCVLYNRLALPQNLAMLFLSYGFYFLLRAKDEKNIKFIYPCSILVALSSITVYSSILFILLLYLVAYQLDKKTIKSAVFIPVIPVLLLFMVNLIFRFKPLLSDLGAILILGTTEANFPIPSFGFIRGFWSFLLYDGYIFLGLLGIIFYRGRYPWYLYYAVLVTVIGGLRGQSGMEKTLYPSLSFAFPFILLGTGRMAQVMVDNVTSLVNALLNYSGPLEKLKTSPGRRLALLGLFLIIIMILYNLIPQIQNSFSNILSLIKDFHKFGFFG